MIKYYSLHVQFELIEQPQEHRVDLIFLQLFALVKVEIIFDEAPNLFLNGLSPTIFGNLVEVSGHQLLSEYELVVMQRECVDLSFQVLLAQLLELFAVLGQQQIDVKRIPK